MFLKQALKVLKNKNWLSASVFLVTFIIILNTPLFKNNMYIFYGMLTYSVIGFIYWAIKYFRSVD